jgi:hypothetical protein
VAMVHSEKVHPAQARDQLLLPSRQAHPASVICQSHGRNQFVPSGQSGPVLRLAGSVRLRLTHTEERLRLRRSSNRDRRHEIPPTLEMGEIHYRRDRRMHSQRTISRISIIMEHMAKSQRLRVAETPANKVDLAGGGG